MASKITKKNPQQPRARVRNLIASPRRSAVSLSEEELFAKAFRLSPHPIGITELESGHCLEVNDACLEIFGFRRDEVVGHTTLILGIWPDPQERVRFIDRLKSEGTVRNLEVSMRMKNGNLRQFLISTELIALNGKQCLLTMGNDITERKQAEEALRQSEERWQLAATGTTDGIWDWDVAGHTVFLSARWKQVRGYCEAEIGVDETEWSSRIHPEDLSRVMATVQSYFNKEIPTFECEYRTRRKDGTYYWVNDRGVAVWDAQGRVVRMVGSETDITERKRAEAELRHSEEQFRTVVESVPNGILSVDGGGRIVLVNGQIERQFGYRREELIGHPVEMLLPGRIRKDHAGLRETYQEAPEFRSMGRGRDLYGLRKDGSELPIEIGLCPVETISGTMVLASVVDITERKQREHALAEQRRLYKTVTDNAVLALFIMDDRQQCVFMNPAAEALTGFALAEVIGRPLHDVVHHTRPDGSHYPLRECPIDQAFPKNDLEQGEEVFVHKDGHFYHVAFTASPIRNELGQPVGTVIEVQDITERKRAESALRESEERLRLFVEYAPAAIAMFDEEMKYLAVSRRFLNDYHVAESDVIGRSHYDVFPDIPDRWREYHRRGLQGEVLREQEDRFERADGTIQWLHWEIHPWYGHGGGVGGILIFAEDITERKRVEEALEQSREDLDRAQEVGQIGWWRLDTRRNVLTWSDENHRIFGVQKGTPLSYESFLAVVHPDDREDVDRQWQAGLRGEPYDIEHRIVVEGQVKWVREKAYLEFNKAGALLGGFGITEDITQRKEAEAALQESEERFRTMAQAVPSFLFETDAAGWNVWTSEGWCRFTGQTPEQVAGHGWANALHPDDRAANIDRWVQCMKDGVPFEAQQRLRRTDGTYAWVIARALPVRDDQGTIRRWVGSVTNVDDIVLAREALREREERLRYHVSNAGLAVIEWDVQWQVTRWEGEAERMFGWTAQEMLGKRLPDLKLVYGDDIARVQQVMAQLRDGVTRTLVSHNRNYTKSGGVIHCIWHNSVLLGGEGRLSSVLSLVQDNTAQVEAEAALHELNQTLEQRVTERTRALRKGEERFRTFLGNAPNVTFMKSSDGRYLYVNRRFEEAFQLEQNEIVGKTDMELFSREQAEQFHNHDRAVFDAGKAVEFEETALYADGRHTNIVLKFPVRDGAGHVYAIGGIVTDITDRKKIELALQQNQRVLQEQRQELQRLTEQLFTAQDGERQRIARDLHDDFSQRLAALVLDVAALQRHPPLLPEVLGKTLEPVRAELTQLSNDLHTLAYQLHPSLLKHAGLQAAIEDHIDKAIERTGLSITLKTNDLPASIPLDWSTSLFRVFQESLQNVVKHAKATEVLVRLSGSSRGIGLSVVDNGKGFDARDKSGRQKGIGLISMQERLRLMNGFLNIHSRPADGTKVCAWIPFQEKTP
ncbi:sensor histidine kinase [Nitrospira sp. CMX1]